MNLLYDLLYILGRSMKNVRVHFKCCLFLDNSFIITDTKCTIVNVLWLAQQPKEVAK